MDRCQSLHACLEACPVGKARTGFFPTPQQSVISLTQSLELFQNMGSSLLHFMRIERSAGIFIPRGLDVNPVVNFDLAIFVAECNKFKIYYGVNDFLNKNRKLIACDLL